MDEVLKQAPDEMTYDEVELIFNKNDKNILNTLIELWKVKENTIKNYGKLNRSDLFKYYDVIDILIMPSISEGLGMSMVECCIAGIPTISSNTDGAKQFIINEFNGLIINSREPNYYIEAINKIIKSYDTYSLNCINFSKKNNNFISKPIYFP